jgi:hypothetical protein
MAGGTVYGNDEEPGVANKLEGSGSKAGVSLCTSDATAEWGDGSPIITGRYTDATLIGTNLPTGTRNITVGFNDGGSGAFSQETFTLYKGGAATKTISLSGSWNGQTWYVGAQAVGTGTSVTLNAVNYSVGPHTLSVTVRKVTAETVVYWSKALTFTVEN